MILSVESFREVNHRGEDCSGFWEVLVVEDEGNEVDEVVVDRGALSSTILGAVKLVAHIFQQPIKDELFKYFAEEWGEGDYSQVILSQWVGGFLQGYPLLGFPTTRPFSCLCNSSVKLGEGGSELGAEFFDKFGRQITVRRPLRKLGSKDELEGRLMLRL